ncbi:MAG: PASTA domain-containing protein [Ruminococcus sp.]|nr:PASTA domain-containing protein [Ruminococcus sp.]
MPKTGKKEVVKNGAEHGTMPTVRMKKHLNVGVLTLMSVICAAVIANLFKVSVLEHSKYESLANNYHFGTLTLEAQRGAIYDATGKPLAWSATVYNVYIDPTLFREEMEDIEQANQQNRLNAQENNETPENLINIENLKASIANYLSNKLGIETEEVYKGFEQEGRYYVLQTQVEKKVADDIMAYFSEMNLVSFATQASTRRYYPQNELAASVIGFTNSDGNGQYGLEYQYDSYLSGVDGRVVSAQAANGEEMPYRYSTTYDAENGDSLYLTIDTTIQYYLEKALSEMVTKFNVQERACGIIMNPKTGAIYAMATYPSFDLNSPSEIFDEVTAKRLSTLNGQEYTDAYTAARELQWKNKATTEIYYPGSVFKVVTSAAGFDEKLINLKEDMFTCTGVLTIADANIHCSNRSGHGTQNFTTALTNSCNPAFMEIGMEIGRDRFYQYLDGFGLTEPTGIDLPGESSSIHVSETMSIVDLVSSSFGQVNKITPIQMITAYAAVINGGTLVTPYIVDKIVDEDGNIVEEHQVEVKRQVISEETSEIMRQQLEAVVENNNGHNAHIDGYRIGGKSGTSEKLDENRTGEEEHMEYVASYGCFAPADDPEIILLMMADEPDRSINYYGGAVVAPYVRNVMADVLPYLGYYPETDNIVESNNVTVPLMQDKSVEDAKTTLDELGLQYEVVGEGANVIRQCPRTGSSVAKGGVVLLYTDNATEVRYAEVPNLLEKTAAEAEQLLQQAGLNIVTIGASAENAEAKVQFQSEPEGALVERGTVVSVTMTINDQTG